ncbi:MAG TPA: bifunctional DNA-formamidopyrimidine glycosylase/DNA-(apurinic or apyrimidinic site) lyase [Thermoanaerobaculia bacterium]|jgi:formamidopyrimidine-DNA glycosylase|nr:bifunctional DNA-formamidopyrimidine glycosylase/DNA-(apurinic or apyrimidinic site) lyase [Thermoanaerobaculia bacterium]
MPELPEVEVLRRSLEPHLVGDRIERVEVTNPSLREPVDVPRLRRAARGREVVALRRRSKYLLIDLEGGWTVVVHLGMSGRLTLAPAAAPPELHEHVAFHLRSGRRLRFRDPRRFGVVFATKTAELDADPHFVHLGPEPLEPGLSGKVLGEVLARAAAGRRGPVKAFLMDAGVVVGVGNIYASETLHRAGVHPDRSVARISRQRWQRVAESAMAVLRQAISQGGTTLNDFADGEGRSGYFQVSLTVYDREGEPCLACGRPVRRIVQAGRSTFYCPGCQR